MAVGMKKRDKLGSWVPFIKDDSAIYKTEEDLGSSFLGKGRKVLFLSEDLDIKFTSQKTKEV